MTDDIITLRNYLRVGAQNALCRWQLCEMTGWTDRHLRKVIEAARCEVDESTGEVIDSEQAAEQ